MTTTTLPVELLTEGTTIAHPSRNDRYPVQVTRITRGAELDHTGQLVDTVRVDFEDADGIRGGSFPFDPADMVLRMVGPHALPNAR